MAMCDLGGTRFVSECQTRTVTTTPSIRWTTITLDCSDAEALGTFYSGLFGWEMTSRDGAGWVQLRNPTGGVGLNLQAEASYEPPTWPEEVGRQGKMMHFELLVEDLDIAVDVVVRSGGSVASWQPPDRDPTRIRIMLDPAGHPFCLFVEGE